MTSLRHMFGRLRNWVGGEGRALVAVLYKHWMVAVIVTLMIFALALWKIPEMEVSSLRGAQGVGPLDIFHAENTARTTLAQILGGAIVLAGLGFTWWRIEVARQGQLNERFTRAVEQLGSDKKAVRAGAVFALGRLVKESERDRHSVIHLLAAFVREHSPRGCLANNVRVPPDVQAALTVLGQTIRRSDPEQDFRADLSDADLPGAELRGANLSGCDLSGTNLRGAQMEGAVLREARLWGACLDLANLSDADLGSAELEGSHAEGADFSGANLLGANMRKSILVGADLSGANLLHVNLFEARLGGADLRQVVEAPLPFGTVYVNKRTQLPESARSWVMNWIWEEQADATAPAEGTPRC